MTEVIVYTSFMCPYCERAKRLLKSKNVAFTEIDVTMDPEKRQVMTEKAGGRRTVPQIFIGDAHVGGSDDLALLDKAGKLDPMLGLGG